MATQRGKRKRAKVLFKKIKENNCRRFLLLLLFSVYATQIEFLNGIINCSCCTKNKNVRQGR